MTAPTTAVPAAISISAPRPRGRRFRVGRLGWEAAAGKTARAAQKSMRIAGPARLHAGTTAPSGPMARSSLCAVTATAAAMVLCGCGCPGAVNCVGSLRAARMRSGASCSGPCSKATDRAGGGGGGRRAGTATGQPSVGDRPRRALRAQRRSCALPHRCRLRHILHLHPRARSRSRSRTRHRPDRAATSRRTQTTAARRTHGARRAAARAWNRFPKAPNQI